MNPRIAIRQLARRLQRASAANHQAAQAKASRVVRDVHLKEIPETGWQDLHDALEHNPAYGLALAQVLYALAKASRKHALRTRAELELLHALNVCSDFEGVIRLAAVTGQRIGKTRDTQALARVWLEGAWAETYRGDLSAAQARLEHADRALQTNTDHEFTLRADWIRARILRERGEYETAFELFSRVRAVYIRQGQTYEAMQLLREIGHTTTKLKPSDAFRPLDTARAFFVRTRCPIQVAQCDYLLAQTALDLNRFDKAAAYLHRAQTGFRRHGNHFFGAQVNLELAYLAWYLDRPTEMLEYARQAYSVFTALGVVQEISTAEINIGVALVALNRFAEAVPYYSSGLDHALSSGRTTKAAVCLVNLAEVYIKQGQPARALEHLLRARALLVRAKSAERLVECDLDLAKVYEGIGSYKNALAAIARAHKRAAQEKMTTRLAQCELYRAQLFLLRGQARQAAAPLRRARTHFVRNRQASHVAWCDRLLAELEVSHRKQARARLATSRATFFKQRQFVEVAFCDLTRGELALRWRAWDEAAGALAQAEQVLRNDFPDQHARILYDLGCLAQGQAQPHRALDYLVQSAQTLAQVRRSLGLESLSNSFFGGQSKVVRRGLELAHSLGATTQALALIEAAKTQTFSQTLPVQEWHLQQADGRVRELEKQQRDLYDRLAGERARRVVQLDADNASSPASSRAVSSKRDSLETLSADYERVANELRLARRSFAGVPELDPFSLQAFRAAAARRWGDAWLALDYFLDKGRLYIVSIDAGGVRVDTRRWGWHEQHLLQQATHLHPEIRELVFNHTVRGQKVQPRENPLAELAELLLPPQARALTDATLLIAPHHLLHQLAFQALEIDGAPLATRVTVAYAPTLQAYTQLRENAPATHSDNVLLCGAQNFSDPLPELKYARREVEHIRRQLPAATVLWQAQATRAQFLEWNQSGTLREFSILHFATHTTVLADTPHLSAIQLDDHELTVLDLTNFTLNARLVTLSACSSNIGKGGSGDEWVSLARAFFYAGARALVASLWQVDDESTSKLMQAFYRELSGGASISAALHTAQQNMIRRGATPYQWAAFVAIGDV